MSSRRRPLVPVAVDPATATRLGALAARLVPVAADLVVRVHEEGRESIGELLGRLNDEERWALPVVLAAMVPPDRPVSELLAWVTWDEHGRPLPPPPPEEPGLRPHGTHAAYVRHRAKGERPCPACVRAERDYHRTRRARRPAA